MKLLNTKMKVLINFLIKAAAYLLQLNIVISINSSHGQFSRDISEFCDEKYHAQSHVFYITESNCVICYHDKRKRRRSIASLWTRTSQRLLKKQPDVIILSTNPKTKQMKQPSKYSFTKNNYSKTRWMSAETTGTYFLPNEVVVINTK